MSLNDLDPTLNANKGVGVHPGVANPTAVAAVDPMTANFVRPYVSRIAFNKLTTRPSQVTDPTSETVGAGAGENFTGHKDAQRNFSKTAGVVEGRPGIIESTHIDPLSETSNKGGHAYHKFNTLCSGPC